MGLSKKWYKSSFRKMIDRNSQRAMQDLTIPSAKHSKSSRAWRKMKHFFASLGEPPTDEYDRQQEAQKEMKTNGRGAFGAVNYGPYQQGGPFTRERM